MIRNCRKKYTGERLKMQVLFEGKSEKEVFRTNKNLPRFTQGRFRSVIQIKLDYLIVASYPPASIASFISLCMAFFAISYFWSSSASFLPTK